MRIAESATAAPANGRIPPGLIVNADDLAIHPRINAGILSAWNAGILTSATMLMTTPYLAVNLAPCVAYAWMSHLDLTLRERNWRKYRGQLRACAGALAERIALGGNFASSNIF